MIALLGAGAVACAVWAVYYALMARQQKQEVLERVGEWVHQTEGDSESWSDSLSKKLDNSNLGKKLRPQLEQASLDMDPSDYMAILFGAGLGIAFILKIGLGAPWPVGILIAVPLVPIGSKFFLSSRKHIYVNRINAQLSEACRLLSSAARAGLSVPQGLELVVKEMPAPISKELGIVVKEVQLGRNLEAALRDFLKRVHSKDIQVFVNALIIQRRAGGDLAKVLSEMANTMEERKIIHQNILAVTSQARYSAYSLPLISVLVVFMLSKMIDGFYNLFTTIPGMIIFALFVGLQVIGVLLVRKISDIRV
ncbi:type II secretion system F family protein [Polycladomyces sp. WAk]|uniref:Type II secretion system F family protein n=1 Tax=Polycladomyces zharkentensis TaxID=2807616 RepID=A0ABS2WM80_9BACL|nr:type II secretion system F family protein [Polycladomyces sp. WAk]MBN2910621.1 type II secretion system F family protein [Polycladomyces sp. WAk]